MTERFALTAKQLIPSLDIIGYKPKLPKVCTSQLDHIRHAPLHQDKYRYTDHCHR